MGVRNDVQLGNFPIALMSQFVNIWIVDCGASNHMTSNGFVFNELAPYTAPL